MDGGSNKITFIIVALEMKDWFLMIKEAVNFHSL